MQSVPQDLLKQYVQSQNFTSTADIMAQFALRSFQHKSQKREKNPVYHLSIFSICPVLYHISFFHFHPVRCLHSTRLQPALRTLDYPVCHCGTTQTDPFSGPDLFLPCQRQSVYIFLRFVGLIQAIV